MHPDAAVEVGVGRLLERQFDVAANRAPTDVFRAAVRCFHDARAAAGHHSKPEPRNGRAHFSSQLVMRIVVLNAGGAENGHARTDEVEGAKSAQEIAHHSQEGDELLETRARSFEEDFIRTFGWRGQSRTGGSKCSR